MFASAIVVLTLWYDATRPRFVAFIVTYGIFSGGYNALLPATIVELYGDESYDIVTGVIYFLRGIGTLTGPPVAGALLGTRAQFVPSSLEDALDYDSRTGNESYDRLAIYTGMLLLGASICACGVRCGEARRGIWKWKG